MDILWQENWLKTFISPGKEPLSLLNISNRGFISRRMSASAANHYRESEHPNLSNSGCDGVCIMSTPWKDGQHPSFINFISRFLNENSCRLKFVSINPDLIFNCGGVSAAFIFVTNWDSNDNASIFSRYGMELGRPAFMPVKHSEMGFEKIVKVALARGACRKLDVTAKLRAEREISVQSMNLYIKVVTSIPGIDNHDANSMNAEELISALAPFEHLFAADSIAEKRRLSVYFNNLLFSTS